MSRKGSFEMAKGNDIEDDAYAAMDDSWDLKEDDGMAALSRSIKAHALNLQGEDTDVGLGDGPAQIPLGSTRSEHERSSRTFNSLSNVDRSSEHSRTTRKQAPSAVRASRRGLGGRSSKVSPDSKNPTKGSKSHAKAATKLRALMALLCWSLSVLLALFVGYSASSLWMTNTQAEVVPDASGIPQSDGQAHVYNGTFEIPNLEEMNVILPMAIENGYADWRIPFPASERSDLPVFWITNENGGTFVQGILGHCLGLVEMSDKGADHEEPIMETSKGTRYINVDATTSVGLQRALKLKVVESSLADVVFTPLIFEVAEMFSTRNPGRLFTIIRHPLERSLAIYQQAKANNQAMKSMSLSDFATNELTNNELVRSLVGKGRSDDLTEDDLFVAMEVIRRKFVVGLVDRMPESLSRFQNYFGWVPLLVDGVSKCQSKLLTPFEKRIKGPKPGSEAYNILLGQNRLDLRLYEYAQYMYDIQGGHS